MSILLIVAVIWGLSAVSIYAYSAMMVFAGVLRYDEGHRQLYLYPQVIMFKTLIAALPDTVVAWSYYLSGPVGLVNAVTENRLKVLEADREAQLEATAGAVRASVVAEVNQVLAAPFQEPASTGLRILN